MHRACATFVLIACFAAPLASADAPVDTPTNTAPTTADAAPFELRLPGVERIEDPFLRALVGGRFDLNVRWRYEFANVAGLDDSHALTMRTRLGYTTERYRGFQAALQLEDSRALDDDEYNAAGLNRRPTLSAIADPEDTELNQLWLDYDFRALDDALPLSVRAGRQRIVLDNGRFVGNSGWRQLEQTFDAARFIAEPADRLRIDYSYLWAINRVFGPDAERDFDSDSHLLNVAYRGLPVGTLTAFAYLLDLEGGAAPMGETVSSQTYGLRLAGDRALRDGLRLAYHATAAWQADYADNPTDYGAPYLGLEGRLDSDAGPFGGLGFELLGSDDGAAAVTTPIATLHGHNGFADAFTLTPAVGLRDYYAFAGTQLPQPLDGTLTVWVHHFTGDDDSDPLGWEFDAAATHRFNDHLAALIKWAWFDGDAGLADVHRFWLQLELSF